MTIYFVWRRSDGHVAATTYPPDDFVGGNGSVTRNTIKQNLRAELKMPPGFESGGVRTGGLRVRYRSTGWQRCRPVST